MESCWGQSRLLILWETLGVVYGSRFRVFLIVQVVEFWCVEPFGRRYLGYGNLFGKSLPCSLILGKLMPRIIFKVFLSRQFSPTFFLNFVYPSLKLHFVAAGKNRFECLACARAVGRCIQDIVDYLIRLDKDR